MGVGFDQGRNDGGVADGVEIGGIIVGALSEPGCSGLKDGQDGCGFRTWAGMTAEVADGVEVGGIIVGVLSEPGCSGLKDGQDGCIWFLVWVRCMIRDWISRVGSELEVTHV